MNEHDRIEETLADALADLVEGEHPSPDVRDSIATGVGFRPHRARPRLLPAAAAAAVVVVALLAAVVSAGSGGGDSEVATSPDASTTTEPEPQVLGDRIQRKPSTTVPPTTVAEDPTSTTTSTTTTAPPAPPTTAATAQAPAPTTATTITCHNSVDPACGPFRWDPAPTNRPATLTLQAPDEPLVQGEPATFTVEMSDPDGRVTLACYSVSLDRSDGKTVGTCASEPQHCPARYGPWSPPAPKGGSATATTQITFEGYGKYVIDVVADRADGCDNVDPYRSGGRTQLTVQVLPAP